MIENNDDKIVEELKNKSFKTTIINRLKGFNSESKISKFNKTNGSKLNTVKAAHVVSINRDEVLFNNEKLQVEKKSIIYLDSASAAKQIIENSFKEDSNLVDKVFLAKYDKDSVENGLKTNNVSINKTHYKIKEPIHFSLTVFNNYMMLNKAYNGADNSLINSFFGLNYNEQANQSYSLGLLLGLTRNKLSLKVGFAYNTVQFDKLFIQPNSVGLGANAKKESLVNNFGYYINIIDQSLSFAEMPILLGYTIGSKKVNYTFETGLAFQYLMQTNSYLLNSDANGFSYTTQNHTGNSRFNHFQLATQASILINYNITKHVSIYGGPIAKLHVWQYYNQDFTQRNAPIYLGINSGINFKF